MAIDWPNIQGENGSTYFLTLEGAIDPPGQQIEDISEPYEDGVAFRKTAKRGIPFRLSSVAFAGSAAGAKSVIEDYKSAQGTLVTINRDGVAWEDYTVIAVTDCDTKTVISPGIVKAADGTESLQTVGRIITATWHLQHGGSPS